MSYLAIPPLGKFVPPPLSWGLIHLEMRVCLIGDIIDVSDNLNDAERHYLNMLGSLHNSSYSLTREQLRYVEQLLVVARVLMFTGDNCAVALESSCERALVKVRARHPMLDVYYRHESELRQSTAFTNSVYPSSAWVWDSDERTLRLFNKPNWAVEKNDIPDAQELQARQLESDIECLQKRLLEKQQELAPLLRSKSGEPLPAEESVSLFQHLREVP